MVRWIRLTCSSRINAAVCVVLASGGYPVSYEKGFPIEGLESLKGRGRRLRVPCGNQEGARKISSQTAAVSWA